MNAKVAAVFLEGMRLAREMFNKKLPARVAAVWYDNRFYHEADLREIVYKAADKAERIFGPEAGKLIRGEEVK